MKPTNLIKKLLVILFIALLYACTIKKAADTPSYADDANWVVKSTDTADTQLDVFYIYPTIFSNKDKKYMEWSDNATRAKAYSFVTTQADLFSSKARVFAPYVRQLEFKRAIDAAAHNWDKTDMETGISDTIAAFDYYMKRHNNGHPFILFGHSQGAMDLYELLKRNKQISTKSGFVAAYLIGYPKITQKQIENDFKGRDIKAAQGENDIGTIIVWNTQSADAVGSIFTGENTYCINPLNWKTDSTPAPKEENDGARFYNYKETEPSKRVTKVSNFCGAYIDIEKGALIVDLPAESRYDAKGLLGKGVFHTSDIELFAENISQNIYKRLQAWKNKYDKRQ